MADGFEEMTLGESGFRLNQGDVGTCGPHAVISLVASQITFKYGKLIDVQDAISSLSHKCKAFKGSKFNDLVKALSCEDFNGKPVSDPFQIRVNGVHTSWVTIKITSENVADFEKLYALEEARNLRSEQCYTAVIGIKTDVKKHSGHAVVATGSIYPKQTKCVTAMNSWGGSRPDFYVYKRQEEVSQSEQSQDAVLYLYHTIIKVEIAEEYDSSQDSIYNMPDRFSRNFSLRYRECQRKQKEVEAPKKHADQGRRAGTAPDFQVGGRVCLHSMKDDSYNGSLGKLVHYSEEAKRWNVDLGPPHFKTIAVRPTNLQIRLGHEV